MDVDGTPELYTVWARDVAFKLTRTQLQHDSPNFFTAAFLTPGFTESETKVTYTDRNPQIFSLIVDYLSGYDILPLSDNVGGGGEDAQALFRRNLIKDADFFNLDKLLEALTTPAPPLRHFLPKVLRESCGLVDGRASGSVEIVEWDTFIHKNAQGHSLDAIVVLRDVKLRFQSSSRRDDTVWTVRMDSDLLQTSSIQLDRPLYRHCVQDIPRDHNILLINGDPVRCHGYYAADAGFTQDELLHDRAISINGVIAAQSDLFNHDAFRCGPPTYSLGVEGTPFAAVRLKMDVIDDLEGQVLHQTILHAYEVFLVAVDPGGEEDPEPGPKKVFEMIYARCSTQEHLSMEMGRQLSKLQTPYQLEKMN